MELIDSVGQREEGSPEVIIVEEAGDEEPTVMGHAIDSRRSSSDLMPETIVIEGQMETDRPCQGMMQYEQSMDMNELSTSETREKTDRQIVKQDISKSEDLTATDDVTAMDDIVATDDVIPGNLIIADEVDEQVDEGIAMATESDEYPSTGNGEGSVGYQSKPVSS